MVFRQGPVLCLSRTIFGRRDPMNTIQEALLPMTLPMLQTFSPISILGCLRRQMRRAVENHHENPAKRCKRFLCAGRLGLALFAAILAGTAGSSLRAQTITGDLTVGGTPSAVGVNPATN